LPDPIVESFSNPIPVSTRQVQFAVSIGAAICPADRTTVDALLPVADGRMYTQKRAKDRDSEVIS